MKSRKPKGRFSIRVHLTTAFIAVLLLFGITQTVSNYLKVSHQILANSEKRFDHIATDISSSFNNSYGTVAGVVQMLSYSQLLHADNILDRWAYLPMLMATLEGRAEVAALSVGYADGEYFIVRRIDDQEMRNRFASPDETRFVVDNIDIINEAPILSRHYYSAEQNLLSSKHLGHTIFNPVRRPWFTNAINSVDVVTTPPYLFFFMGTVGFTVSRHDNRTGAVAAADITLDQIATSLRDEQITPRSELLIYNDNLTTVAYRDPQLLIRDQGIARARLAQVAELPIPQLADFFNNRNKQHNGIQIFESQGENWLGVTRRIKLTDDSPANLLIVTPKMELLEDAFAARNQSVLISLLALLLSLPLALYLANLIARPLTVLADETKKIRRFKFSNPLQLRSVINEIDMLSLSLDSMKSTISRFTHLIQSIAGETSFDRLLNKVTEETMLVSQADGAFIYLLTDDENELNPYCFKSKEDSVASAALPKIPLADAKHFIVRAFHHEHSLTHELKPADNHVERWFSPIQTALGTDALRLVAVPLKKRDDEHVGVLCLVFIDEETSQTNSKLDRDRLAFVEALSGFSALTIENGYLIEAQKQLLEAIIKLIAGAIDAKSPYTAGHCQRVPELTHLLAKAACESKDGIFKDFDLNEEQWEELRVASWLHDCGKVTTPEYVVDKATKLETLYDRIHEIRMRFEVLKRDAEIRYLKAIQAGTSPEQAEAVFKQEIARLDEDFALVARSNLGSENMHPEDCTKLQEIASRTWLRTLDDSIGISWEERQRKRQCGQQELPVEENLLQDREDHLLQMNPQLVITENKRFNLALKDYRFNRGELYNLTVKKGTLTDEERFIINHHIVQTITMLEQLPFPKHLRNVPEIAGGHHEKMDGTGYPLGLNSSQMSIAAKIMAIADIFEALTAQDRPYKQAKTLSEAMDIMLSMQREGHIDPDLFQLFISSGVYQEYAEKFLSPEQHDMPAGQQSA